jgi:protein-L-isoaspartate(D-aspartate) O-methyltransferase
MRLRKAMVRALGLDGPVAEAFIAVPREAFVPEWVPRVGLAGIYRPEISFATKTDHTGQPVSSSSAPSIMAPMLQALDLRPGHRVLEIGAGTGYNTALLSHLVGPKGKVVSIELDPAIARTARAVLRSLGVRARVVVGDGHQGFPAGATYDRIIATAASSTVPRAWFDQLADGGLVELPLETTGLGVLPTFAKKGAQLVTQSVLLGAFMGMRQSSDDAGPRHSGVSIAEQSPTSQRVSYLSGTVLTRLGSPVRRALLRVLADGPTITPWHESGDPLGYLLVSRGVAKYHGDAGWGVGVLEPSGRGVVVVARTPNGLKRLVWGAGADETLDTHLAAWRGLGRPGLDRLRLTVTFPGRGPGRVRRSWAPADDG